MKAIAQRIQGELIQEEGVNTIKLHDPKPVRDAPNLLYLRYAFVTLGREAHVLPALLIDDWGNEIRGLKVYRFFREHAAEFPRAELFGFGRDGQAVQHFLREFEHYVKLPCYAYSSREQPIEAGVLITQIVFLDEAVDGTTAVKLPPKQLISTPLRRAQVSWLATNH